MPDASKPGLLIVGHGTREPQGVDGFLAMVAGVAGALGDVAVEPCFLELARPTIAEGVRRLAERGVTRVLAMPLMLFAAGHVRRDIPKALVESAAESGVEVELLSHLGCHPRIVELSARRYGEAVSGRSNGATDSTILVIAGRGSRDARATAEMRRLAELRRADARVQSVEIGFLAMERPPLKEVLARVGQRGAKRVVVQPHLLLPGLLMDQVRQKVEWAGRQWPTVEWLVTEPLGPDRLVSQAIVEVYRSGAGGKNRGTSVAVG